MLSRFDLQPAAPPKATPGGSPRTGAVVLAAVDADGPLATSRGVLEVAAGLRGRRGERPALHVVYGWTLVGASILECPVRGVSRRCMRDLVSRVRRQHRARVLELCDQVLPCRPDGVFVRRGDPRKVIPEAARRLRADLVVLGGSPGPSIWRIPLGSVARAIVDEVSCDVLTVRGRYPW